MKFDVRIPGITVLSVFRTGTLTCRSRGICIIFLILTFLTTVSTVFVNYFKMKQICICQPGGIYGIRVILRINGDYNPEHH
jgi:hypothetical protein